ncbi:MAG: hypothetical protein ACJATI_003222 [Halioglobus sp.]|jgi:hypothetical protein
MKTHSNMYNFNQLSVEDLISKWNYFVASSNYFISSNRSAYIRALKDALNEKGNTFPLEINQRIRVTKSGKIKPIYPKYKSIRLKNLVGVIGEYANISVVKMKKFHLDLVVSPIYVLQKAEQSVTLDFTKYGGIWQIVSLDPTLKITGSVIVMNSRKQKFIQQFFSKDFIIMEFDPSNTPRFPVGESLLIYNGYWILKKANEQNSYLDLKKMSKEKLQEVWNSEVMKSEWSNNSKVFLNKLVKALIEEKRIAENKGIKALLEEKRIAENKGVKTVIEENRIAETKGVKTVIEENRIAGTKGVKTVIEENRIAGTKGVKTVIEENRIAETKGVKTVIEENRIAETKAVKTVIEEKRVAETINSQESELIKLLELKDLNNKIKANNPNLNLLSILKDINHPQNLIDIIANQIENKNPEFTKIESRTIFDLLRKNAPDHGGSGNSIFYIYPLDYSEANEKFMNEFLFLSYEDWEFQYERFRKFDDILTVNKELAEIQEAIKKVDEDRLYDLAEIFFDSLEDDIVVYYNTIGSQDRFDEYFLRTDIYSYQSLAGYKFAYLQESDDGYPGSVSGPYLRQSEILSDIITMDDCDWIHLPE